MDPEANPKSKHRFLGILDRYGYLVGVLSAALVLISWIGKEAISGSLRDAQKKLSAIVTDRQDDRIDDVLLQIRNVQKDLLRAEHRESDRNNTTDYFSPVIWSTKTLDRIQDQQRDYQTLLERIDRLRSKVLGLPISSATEVRLSVLADKAHSDADKLKTCELEYESNRRNTLGLKPISRENVPPEKVNELVGIISKYRLETHEIFGKYLERVNEMLAIREEIYRDAHAREALLATLGDITSVGAAFIFVLGSTLGMYSTYRNAKVKLVATE